MTTMRVFSSKKIGVAYTSVDVQNPIKVYESIRNVVVPWVKFAYLFCTLSTNLLNTV